MARIGVVIGVLVAALVSSGSALGAQLIDRNATRVVLEVSTKGGGEAMLVYHAGGKLKHVLVWGAINAQPPTTSMPQVKFKVDYAGGWGKYHTLYWKHFVNQCQKYDGPALPNIVTECKAPDGSYWAVQQWPQAMPDLGFAPWTPALSAKWMEVSHWTGPVASLTANTDWVYSGRFQELFGTYMYAGRPVYGFGTTSVGAPTDNYGRLIYLDTYNAAAYGAGWRRENSFVPHNPTGVWCYGFYTFDPTKGGYIHPPGQTGVRGPGIGERYRLIAAGPGVTPNVELDVPAFHAFDAKNPSDVSYQQEQTALLQSLGDKSCMAGHHS
ncbi:MAG TPA: hypothetical protein VKP14_01705 [Gaiellaceae bacterium]|nr:hypothetical protein [Gaiellaceae bacterium]